MRRTRLDELLVCLEACVYLSLVTVVSPYVQRGWYCTGVLLYGAEAWVAKKDTIRKIDSFHN